MYVCLQLRCLIVVNKEQLSLYSVVSCTQSEHTCICVDCICIKIVDLYK